MEFDLAAFLNRPLGIGGKTIAKRLVLAPMTYLGHAAFRELLEGFGGFGLLFSEMCSARTIPTENRRVSAFFKWRDAELPFLVCQIMGAEPERMAEAARRIADEGFFGVDVNFGCAAGSICRRSYGAALLKAPETAAAIVARIRRAVSIPVLVKFRTGWEDRPAAAVAMARRFEAAGADALTFHPRVAPDRRARPPRWEYIGRVKQAVSIPVFGNGDVFDADDCRRMILSTGCDGVALGRIAVARPWVFAEWSDGVDPGPGRFHGTLQRLLALLPHYFDEPAAMRRFRRFTLYFAANFRFGHTLHRRIQGAGSLAQMAAVVEGFFESPPELNPAPNMNFLQ
ncbi:MAG: tRNA-dihydrouridine synthase family protein [Desulfobacterales bacterium]|jgi:nifR3 family TIM-barrel protein|nr:tRNA-dihydrouridine synthase family protein [Desulfobacterales bacterium]